MKIYTIDQITDTAQSLIHTAQEAYERLEFIRNDANAMALITLFGEITSVQCLDFSQTDYSNDSGFQWEPEERAMYINYLSIVQMFERARFHKRYKELGDDEIMRHIIALFLFHESYHVVQNLIAYSNVQIVKNAGGKSLLGELDTMADCVAARVYSAVMTLAVDGCEVSYHKILVYVYTMSFSIGLLAFSFSADAVHKCERGLSLLLVRQQIWLALQRGAPQLSDGFTLHARLHESSGSMLVTSLEQVGGKKVHFPEKQLSSEALRELSVAISTDNLEKLEAGLLQTLALA